MNEKLFGQKIRNKLNARASLPPAVSDRLLAARQAALAHHATRADRRLGGHGVAVLGGVLREYASPLLSALALVAVVAASDYWMSYQRAADLGEIDSALLADDLPISAYLDRGFDTWLTTSD